MRRDIFNADPIPASSSPRNSGVLSSSSTAGMTPLNLSSTSSVGASPSAGQRQSHNSGGERLLNRHKKTPDKLTLLSRSQPDLFSALEGHQQISNQMSLHQQQYDSSHHSNGEPAPIRNEVGS